MKYQIEVAKDLLKEYDCIIEQLKESLRDAYMEMLKIYECEFSDIQITSETNVSIFINVNFNGSPYRCSVCHHGVVDENCVYEDWGV